LEVDENCVLVLKNAGPKGYPGFPEVGNLPLPKKILDKGKSRNVFLYVVNIFSRNYGHGTHFGCPHEVF
jgi:hypothetical protein